MQRAKKAIKTAASSAFSLMSLKLELPEGLELNRLAERDQLLLEDNLRAFNYLLGLTLENVKQKGEILINIRAILERNGYIKVWQRFVQEVLHLSSDTAENWIALYEFSQAEPELYQDLITYPIRATAHYQISKVFKGSDEAVKRDIKQYLYSLTPEELAALDPKKVKQAVVNLELKSIKISEKAKDILSRAGVEASRTDLKRLQGLSHKAQVAAAKLVAEVPGLSLRESITTVNQQNRAAYRERKRIEENLDQEKDDFIDVEKIELPSEQMVNPVVYGAWMNLLNNEADRSLDVVFCEIPFQGSWLEYHGHVLFQTLERKLCCGGICLVTLGQKDLPQLGQYLPSEPNNELKVAWVCVLHRTNGHYPRILGLNIISGYVPLVILYKSPYRAEHLVSDIQSHSDQPPVVSPEWQELLLRSQSAVYAYKGDPKAPMGFDEKREKQTLDTLERCLRYYLESYLQPGHHCYHLIMDLERSFGTAARMASVEACLKKRASRLTTAINLTNGEAYDGEREYDEVLESQSLREGGNQEPQARTAF